MDPLWQPHLGAVAPARTNSEACGLLAAGWQAQPQECWIGAEGRAPRMVALDTWHFLRDRSGFVRPRTEMAWPERRPR